MAMTGTLATIAAPRRGRGLVMILACLLALGGLLGDPATPAGAAGCVVTSVANAGAGTLRAALGNTDGFANCTAITFALPGSGPWTITLASSLPLVTRALTIAGPGPTRLGIHGNNTFTLLYIETPGLAVGISGLSLRYGEAVTYYGGNLRSQGANLALTDVYLTGATAADGLGGAGAYITGGTSTLTNVAIAGNTAPGNATFGTGAGLYVNDFAGDTAVAIANSTIINNESTGNSGGGLGVAHYDAGNARVLAVTLTNSTVGTPQYPNIAEIGGGISAAGAALTLIGSTVSGNVAGRSGGGLFLSRSGGTATLTSSIVSENVAGTDGGGFYLDQGMATLTDSTISENQAGRSGGGFNNAYHSKVTLTNSTVSGNQASDSGGGFTSRGASTTWLRFVTVTANSVADGVGDGGGIFVDNGFAGALSSIVAGNRRGSAAPDDCVGAGAISSQGRNLWGDQVACPNNAGLGDQNLAALNVNLTQVLDPALAGNGGPTRTHALVAGSPAIDNGDNLTCPTPVATDQRGVARTDGRCDVGAYEYGPPPAPTQAALTVAMTGTGAVGRSPAGGGGGPYQYPLGTTVTLTPQPGAGQTFVGWTVDGVARGWAPSLTITMAADHTVRATFAATRTFGDTGSGRPDYAAIVALATRGSILGLNAQQFGPDQGVQRAQMAALIARATPAGPGTPPATLTPPACVVAGTWDCEAWPTAFTDRNGLDANLWRNVGALGNHGVAVGYAPFDCAAKGLAYPCFGPTDPVTYAETITFITRALIAKGYWHLEPAAPQPYAGVPAVFAPFVATFAYHTQGVGGVPAPPVDWNAGATRGWFAMALWRALDSYWGSDTANRGGYVP